MNGLESKPVSKPSVSKVGGSGALMPKKQWVWVGILVIAIALLLGEAFGTTSLGLFRGFPGASSSEWQAVFLINNQVYFGHLRNYNRDYAVLKDVFYLRVAEPLQQGSPPQSSLNLVKLGGELHGPEDTMYIPKDKIVFWENMKKDSQVVQAINGFLGAK